MRSLEFKERIWGEEPFPAVIRIVGYGGITEPKFEAEAQNLIKRYGEAKVRSALGIVTSTNHTKEPHLLYLKHDIREIVWPILGPDPQNPPWWASSFKSQPGEGAASAPPKKPRRKRASAPNQAADRTAAPS